MSINLRARIAYKAIAGTTDTMSVHRARETQRL